MNELNPVPLNLSDTTITGSPDFTQTFLAVIDLPVPLSPDNTIPKFLLWWLNVFKYLVASSLELPYNFYGNSNSSIFSRENSPVNGFCFATQLPFGTTSL